MGSEIHPGFIGQPLFGGEMQREVVDQALELGDIYVGVFKTALLELLDAGKYFFVLGIDFW